VAAVSDSDGGECVWAAAAAAGAGGDVNRATAAELADEAFRGAIEPLAKLIAEHITRDLFGSALGGGSLSLSSTT
jgi:hypothetical protein